MSSKHLAIALGAATLLTLAADPAHAVPFTLEQTLGSPSADAFDQFGFSVSLSADGNTAVVGAIGDDTDAVDAGSAYLFDASTGALLATLASPSADASDRFGESVSLSADGSTALVGAYLDDTGAGDAGSAYVYRDQAIDVPEPASIALLGAGLLTMFGIRRWRRVQQQQA